ncbi:uncharacterized protein LOC120636807 [Pararge aegeria]|uniref:uncharacterized protein LOC120635933 n=1 Tax=Pararge aegeria TaxID=116150 RepID=UPI0019D26EB0|nr:uncharacterized protein LOC120635933 [Pararge aegeria]XP_039763083.1 uncharacterized protein LOC120635939 [Pararge aegeria]XP_039764305.1 uncharacterized protein LOC120636807 [Pararge aegeria]
MENSPNDEYTLKHFYYPLNISDDQDMSDNKKTAMRRSNSIDAFFEKQKKKKRQSKSSCVAQASDGGLSYISSNDDDSISATHLIKIDIYDMKSLKDVSPLEYWKYADLRLKYYVESAGDKHYQSMRDIIYNITKQIAGKHDCKKYFIDRDNQKQ